jgi:hypothetical protein
MGTGPRLLMGIDTKEGLRNRNSTIDGDRCQGGVKKDSTHVKHISSSLI